MTQPAAFQAHQGVSTVAGLPLLGPLSRPLPARAARYGWVPIWCFRVQPKPGDAVDRGTVRGSALEAVERQSYDAP
jgi:hypothetical protein